MNLELHSLDELKSIAQIFANSGMFPNSESMAKVATQLIIGNTLGLNPLESMQGLYMIQGKVGLAANLMAASIKQSGKYDYRAETDEESCTITFFACETDGSRSEIGKTTFSMADAARAGLRGQNWSKYPRAMLFARCISAGYREHCPDALSRIPVYVEQHGETEIPTPPPAVVSKPKAEVSKPKVEVIEAETETEGAEDSLDDLVLRGSTLLEEHLQNNQYDSYTYINCIESNSENDAYPFTVVLNMPEADDDIIPGERKKVEAMTTREVANACIKAMRGMETVTGALGMADPKTNCDGIVLKELKLSGPPEEEKKEEISDPPF